MASQKNFAITPSVSISRSKFRRPSQHKTSFNLGYLVPIYVDEILPGDTVSLDLASLIRMSNPIAPIMDNIYIDYYAFFVPNRLIWNNWKHFMGESPVGTTAAVPDGYYTIPSQSIFSLGSTSIGAYMGLPKITGTNTKVSCLPGRAYFLVYNEWFRDQTLIPAFNIDLSNNGVIASDANGQKSYSDTVLKVAKESDYFTRALPYAQKGNPVSLPLGTTAPVFASNSSTSTTSGRYLGLGSDIAPGANVTSFYTGTNSAIDPNSPFNLMVDLSNATAATINQLRFAFQYQKFLEKDALYGTRYWEILKGHFGITAPDASLQRPELLGHFRQHINIDQVLQTTGSNVATPSSQTLGIPGANSVSGKSEHLISKSFVEHGQLIILACARHDQTYGQGINRMWSRSKRSDFYFPVFANLGAQNVLRKEIYATGVTANDEAIFGYQEAWAEYRYKPSIVSGVMNPAVSGSLSYWNLSNNFGSAPTLSQSFIEQDRTNLSRALVTGNTGPDFIADFFFDAVYVRPMPMYSLPGLIDHH